MSTTTGPRDHGAYGAPPAPVGRRVAAALLDGALTSVCAAPLVAAVLPAWLAGARAAAGTGTAAPAGPPPVLLVAGVVLLLAWGGAQWWCQGTRGWTVGRRALGLRAVDVRSGRPVGLGRALVRSLVVAAGVLACGIGQLLVLLSPLFDSSGRRRGWHDRVAEAVVVDVRGLVAARRAAAPVAPSRRTPGVLAVPIVAPEHEGAAPQDQSVASQDLGVALPEYGAPAPVASLPGPERPADPARGSAWLSATQGGVPHQASPEPGLSPDLDLSPRPDLSSDLSPDPSPGPAPVAAPEPPEPTRTRWTTLAAGRQLDGPDLVLPALGRPGLGPDLDTRQLPAVAAAGLPVPQAGEVPVADVGVPGHAPDPMPAWTPPPTPAPGFAAPDPLDLAVPWSGGSAQADPPLRTPAAGPSPAAPAVPPGPAVPVPPLPLEAFPDPGHLAAPGVEPAWTVRLPDGSVVGLDVPLLVGRNPAPVAGARPVAVDDPGRSVSKTHLMLGADDHGPWVVDRGSTNGTLVTLGDGQRIVCLADRRVRLTDGSLIAFGDLSLSVRVRA